jgi:uncharacterized membrane protein YdjX (TVP38/TMEM64 family)
MKPKKRSLLAPILLVTAIIAVAVALRVTGAIQYFSPENIGKIKDATQGLGLWGPFVYILLYIAACLFVLPGLPITLLAGIFGAIKGTIIVSIASTLGASAAFLVARYALRPTIEAWVEKSPTYKKIDNGVKTHGWRMVMITRLVPLFPFNFQNYAYGLTKIPFLTYVLVSWICMLPATIAYVFAGGSIISGEGNIKKTLFYLGVAACFFVLVSFIPSLIKKRFNLETRGEDS